MNSGIYQIKNKVNGKVYIGQAIDVYERRSKHLSALRNNHHFNPHLQRAWDKYGPKAFEWSFVEACPIDQLQEREKYWVEKTNAFYGGYNRTLGGDGTPGRTQSLFEREERSKISTEMWKDKETRARILKAHGDAMSSEEYREKMREVSTRIWKNYSGEKRERILSRIHSPESREKANASLKETCSLPEHRERLTNLAKVSWENPEIRAKMMESKERLRDNLEYLTKLSVKAHERWSKEEYRSTTGVALAEARKNRTRPVMQIETWAIFENMQIAAESLGKTNITHICDACYGKRKTAYGFHWRFVDETEEERKRRLSLENKSAMSRKEKFESKEVVCMETGEKFSSLSSAARFAGIDMKCIARCCEGKQHTAGGLHWKYAWQSDEEAAASHTVRSHRGKMMCVETGEVFENAKYAALSVNRSPAGITECCKGNRVTCGGLHWRYAE